MRIVVDTNVLMSGIFFGGVPGRILAAWREGRFESEAFAILEATGTAISSISKKIKILS